MILAHCVTLFWTCLPRTAERATTAPLSRCSMYKVRRGISWLCWGGPILPPDPRCHLHTPVASERQVKDSCATPTHRSERASTSGHTCFAPVPHQESSASSVRTCGCQQQDWHGRKIMGRRDVALTGRQRNHCNGHARRKGHERHRGAGARNRVQG